MQFKLLLKQSFRDFLNKIALYLTFTLFLVLTVSVSLGMISFSYGFTNVFNQTLGHDRINAKLNEIGFLPASYSDDDQTPNSEIYVAKEKKNSAGQGYLYTFLKSLDLKKPDQSPIPETELEKLFFGLGYQQGSDFEDLTRKDLLQDKILSEQIAQDELETYNQNALILRQKLNNLYQTKNLILAYLIQNLWNNADQYRIGGSRPSHEKELEIVGQNDSLAEFKWQFLKTDSTMGEIDQQTPKTLKISSTNTQKIWKSVNWGDTRYQSYFQNYHFVYVPMTFLHHFHYHVGDMIDLHFKNWDYQNHPMNPETFLIAGTISAPDLITKSNDQTLVFPYPLIRQVWNSNNQQNGMVGQTELDANLPAVFWDQLYFKVIGQKDVSGGQKNAADWFNTLFSNRQNPSELLQSDSQWSKEDTAYVYEFTQVLFLIISYLIGFLTLGLLFVVFYFITQQIVVLQRKTLFFLKAMGVKNSGLSLLTTFAMFPPLLIGLVVGFFGSLLIQQMMFGIAFDSLSFYLGYWSFNFVYFVALFLIILVAFLIFYIINILLIRSKSLTIEGMGALKDNARFFEFLKTKLVKTSPKFRIGVSFAFKNLYKNLIAYFILSITFGIILFGTQFNSSLTVSAHAYEKWNQPYKSVLYANHLKVFAPTREVDEDAYLPAFTQISDLTGMIPIQNDDDLSTAILAYRQSLTDSGSDFNWKKYYFTREYVRDNLNLITDDKEKYQEFLQKITDKIKQYFPDSSDAVILSVTDLIDTIIEKYREVREEYHYNDGFNILFGQVYLPINNRSILSLSTNSVLDDDSETTDILAYAPNDFATQDHFHLSKFNTSRDFLIAGTYQEFNPATNKMVTKKGKLLQVNVSSYFASIKNLHRDDTITLEVSGLKSAKSARSSTIYAHVNQILKEDTIRSTVYTSQAGLMEYMVEMSKRQISDSDPPNPELEKQKAAYENLLTQLNDQTNHFNLNNTAFDLTQDIPWGLRFITLPVFHQTDPNADLGSRIEDFYDEVELPRFLNSFGKDILVFNLVTKNLLNHAGPFNKMMQRFIIILVVVSLIVSSILITLVLLENREVILLFKAMGYQKSEVNWYLISGYFISTILATITAVIFALVILNATRGVIAQYLSTALYFVWSWQFIVFAFSLALAFCLAISISIIVYTNIQKPRNAFAVL